MLVYVFESNALTLAKLAQDRISLEEGTRTVSTKLYVVDEDDADEDAATFQVDASQLLSITREVQLRSQPVGIELAHRLLEADRMLRDGPRDILPGYSIVARAAASRSFHPFRVSGSIQTGF